MWEAGRLNIYIKWNNNKSAIKLPVLPEAFEISASQNNNAITIHGFGDINLLGVRSLYEITLESFFPHMHYDFCQCTPGKPYDYIKKLQNLFEKNTLVHLIITGTNINGYFTISSFAYGEEDRVGDVSYSLTLTEYRNPGKAASRKPSAAKNSTKITLKTGARISRKTKSCTYTCKKGDTLQKVSKRLTGTSANWRAIYNQNKKKIGTKKKLKAGMKLVIKI